MECRNCKSNNLIEVIDLKEMPIAHRLLESKEIEEEYFPLALHSCGDCGLIQICNPIDPEILYKDFNYCFSAWKPQPHISDEIDILMKYAGRGSVFEIACNDGLFLESLRKKGFTEIVGLEPNKIAGKRASEKGFKVYEDMLTVETCKLAVKENGKFNAVVARQVLEHLTDLDNFFNCVQILLADDGYLFIDIPDIERPLNLGDVTVVWEEHVNYFTLDLIISILNKNGFFPVKNWKFNFSGGINAIIATPEREVGSKSYACNLESDIVEFKQKVDNFGKSLKDKLQKCREAGSKVVLYGVGCRGCTFVNFHNLGSYIDYAIDDQQDRQYKYMPGSKLKIMPSDVLNNEKSVICLLAVNQENENKVKDKFTSNFKKINFVSILSPSAISEELNKI